MLSEIADREADSSRRPWLMYCCKAADQAFAHTYRFPIGDMPWYQNWNPKSSAGLNPRGVCCCNPKLISHRSPCYPNPMEYVSGSVVYPARRGRLRALSYAIPARPVGGYIT